MVGFYTGGQVRVRNLKLLTGIGNGNKNMMAVKVFGTSRTAAAYGPNDCFIPEPVGYEYTDDQTPLQ